jgi:hypothetical protein
MSYPLLAPGTLVKPQVRGLNFHWLRVVEDPGPAHHPRRIIELQRTEPQRADQRVRVRRDRVHTDNLCRFRREAAHDSGMMSPTVPR